MIEGLVIGIDGGGTKTLCLLATTDGRIIGRGEGGPVNSNFVSSDQIKESLATAIRQALNQGGMDCIGDKVLAEALYLGAPGVSADHLKQALGEIPELVCRMAVVAGNDTLNAFTGALLTPPGVVVLAGTGSFALSIDESGGQKAVGGWGPLIGDEGSGYQIGLEALKAVARDLDGRGPNTGLTPLLQEKLSFGTRKELEHLIYQTGLPRREIAAISRYVSQMAAKDDETARKILANAGQELACLALALLAHAPEGSSWPVALTGGVSQANQVLFESFARRIRETYPRSTVKLGRFTPAIGTIILALQAAGIEATEQIIRNLAISEGGGVGPC